MGRILYNWYFKQKVQETELDAAFGEARGYSNDFVADILSPGFSAPPTLTEHSPTQDFTVDVNIPGSGGIVSYDKYGQRVGIPSTINVDLATVSGGPVTLPSAGNEKYVALLVKFSQFESDPHIDGNLATVNFIREDGYEFSVVQGVQAPIGTASKPTLPVDERMVIGHIYLLSTSSVITNSMIDQDDMPRLNINSEIQGFDANEGGVNAGARGVPTANYASLFKFYRGSYVYGGFRLLEGNNPLVDAPVLQMRKFIGPNTFIWKDVSTDNSGWGLNGTYIETLYPTYQVKLGFVGAPDASALFDLRSTTQGFLGVPRMTTAQMTTIASPATGLLIYNTDDNSFYYYDSAAWTPVGTGTGNGGEITKIQYFTLTPTDIANKYVDLAHTPRDPATVAVDIIQGTPQNYLIDFSLITDGSSVKRVNWGPSMGMFSTVISGDIIRVTYQIGATTDPEAINVQTNVSQFNGKLGAGHTDVQAALEALDDHIHAASEIPVDTSGFTGNLTPLDDNVQKVIDTLDKISIGDSTIPRYRGMVGTTGLSTTSASYVDITGATITAGINGSKVLVLFTVPIDNVSSPFSLILNIDGANEVASTMTVTAPPADGVIRFAYVTDALTVNSHTLKMRIKRDSGSDTLTIGVGQFSLIELNSNLVANKQSFSTFNTTSASYVDVTGTSSTVTLTTAKALLLFVSPIDNGTSGFQLQFTDGSGNAYSGTPILQDVGYEQGSCLYGYLIEGLSTGSQTFKVQVKRTSGSDTISLGAGTFNVLEVPGTVATNSADAFITSNGTYADIDAYVGFTKYSQQSVNTASGSYTNVYSQSITVPIAQKVAVIALVEREATTGSGRIALSIDGVAVTDSDSILLEGSTNYVTFNYPLLSSTLTAGNHTIDVWLKSTSGTFPVKVTLFVHEVPIGTATYYTSNQSASASAGDTNVTLSAGSSLTIPTGKPLMAFGCLNAYSTNVNEAYAQISVTKNGSSVFDTVCVVFSNAFTSSTRKVQGIVGHIASASAQGTNTWGFSYGSVGGHLSPAPVGNITVEHGRFMLIEAPVSDTISGYGVVTGGGSQSTTSTSFADVTGLTTNVTTNAGNHSILVDVGIQESSTVQGEFRIVVDGTPIGDTYSSPYSGRVQITFNETTTLTAGAHTIKVQFRCTAAGNVVLQASGGKITVQPMTAGEMKVSGVAATDTSNALLLLTTSIENGTSEFAVQFTDNGTPITDSELIQTEGEGGLSTFQAVVTGLSNGVHDFKAQAKRTAGTDAIVMSDLNLTLLMLPNGQKTGSGLQDMGGFIREEDITDPVVLGGLVPSPYAVLDLQSTDRGFFPPRMTTVQRNAISGLSTSEAGMVIYNTTTNKLNLWNGSTWREVTDV